MKGSLERLQMDYVDVIFAHRPDHTGEVLRTSDSDQALIRRHSTHG